MSYDLFHQPSFHNTISASGAELQAYEQTAKTQEEKVVEYFRRVKRAARFQVAKDCNMIEVSAGRCITNLMNQGVLVKTDDKINGTFGKPNFIYEFVS